MKNKLSFITNLLILIVVLIFILGAMFDIKHEHKKLEEQTLFLENTIKTEYRKRLKESVHSTIYFIDQFLLYSKQNKISQKEFEQNIREYLYDSIHDETRYTWINKIIDFKGGDNYAIRVIHPNLKDTEGKYLSTKISDTKGKFPYLEELEGIKRNGELYFTYYFKEFASEELSEKLSYAKFYKDLDWVIATGIPINTLNKMIEKEKEKYNSNFIRFFIIKLIIAFSLLLVLIFTILWLKNRIFVLIEENTNEKDQTILEQAKLATIGSMIGNIIHQFKQPITVISTISSVLKFEKDEKTLDNKKIDDYTKTINNSISYMVETMETFRNYTKSDKSYKEIPIQSEIKKAKIITNGVLKDKFITLIDNIDYDKEIIHKLVSGELLQVFVNLINNAKDILVKKQIKEPWIKLELFEKANKIYISIEDNGGGVPDDIKEKIFEPYFSTKKDTSDNGLGLYMSKNIITQSIKGKIYVSNTKDGALFTIEIDNK